MDSLSQSGATSAHSDTAAPPIEPPAPPAQPISPSSAEPPAWPSRPVSPIEWLIRLGLFAALIVLIAQQIAPTEASDLVYPLLIFGALAAGYLLASVPAVAEQIRVMADEQPLSMALLPMVLLLPVIVQARATPEFDVTEFLFTGMLLLLPAACAVLNTSALRKADVPLGIITVALPILLPFAREVGGAELASVTGWPEINTIGILVRIGALLLPVLLLLLTTQAQKKRLNFLFACAVLATWYAVEFNAFPNINVVPNAPALEVSYFQLAVIPLFLYIVAIGGRFNRLGLSFEPTPRSISVGSTNLGLLAVIAVPLGLVTGFLTPEFAAPTLAEGAVRAVIIFVLIALPEEILFRGTVLTYLQDVMDWPIGVVIGVSAVLFGAAHLDNPPNVGWYFAFATLAGVFYARAFLATRNVTASAVVHAAVNWAWWLLFRG